MTYARKKLMINKTAKWNNRILPMFSLLLVITLNLYAVGVETLQWANSVGEGMEEAKRSKDKCRFGNDLYQARQSRKRTNSGR